MAVFMYMELSSLCAMYLFTLRWQWKTGDLMKTMIFISYKSEDQAIAKPLADWLEAQGYSTWIDVNRLRGGDDWEQKIYTALRQCWALLLICTERTPESEWVRREFEIAHALQIYIVPLNMREGITLPHYVQDLQYIDFSHS